MEKKYKLKEENSYTKSADGTENFEHILDMIERAEVCIDNIRDNTDLCVNLFNLKKNKSDDDELDAFQLLCQDCITIEQQAVEISQEIELLNNKIDKHLKVSESVVEEILKNILILELHSKEIMEKCLNNVN